MARRSSRPAQGQNSVKPVVRIKAGSELIRRTTRQKGSKRHGA